MAALSSAAMPDLYAELASLNPAINVTCPPAHIASLWKGAGDAFRLERATTPHTTPPTTLIAKCVRAHAPLTSIQVDSYRVELAFYTSGFAADVADSAAIPSLLLGAEIAQPDEGPKKKKAANNKKTKKGAPTRTGCPVLGANPRFYLVLSDLSTTHPLEALDFTFPQATATLSWMARFHAHFTGARFTADSTDAPGRSSNLRGLWSNGTFWTLRRQPPASTSNMARTYEKEWHKRVVKEIPDIDPKTLALARRLCAAAEPLHLRLQAGHAANNPQWFTLVHGDLKGANIALKAPADGADSSWNAAVYDFQWCGGGLAVRDLAYFFISAIDPSCFTREKELLRAYYGGVKSRLKHAAKVAFMTFDTFLTLYNVAFLDMMRWLCAYGLWGGPAEKWALEKAHTLLAILDEEKTITADVYADRLATTPKLYI